jgi:LPXTG-motif cell wall-anchored protein
MIGIIIGLLMVGLLGLGYYRRKKEDKAWVAEERYEESGDWIDKRSGERGTYGSLDRERESERAGIFQQGRLNALCDELADMLGIAPNTLRNNQQPLKGWLTLAEQLLKTQSIPPVSGKVNLQAPSIAAKKLLLARLYDWYPDLLSADIEQLQYLDAHTTQLVEKLATQGQ